MPLTRDAATRLLSFFCTRPLTLHLWCGTKPKPGAWRECKGGYRPVPLDAGRWWYAEDTPAATQEVTVTFAGPLEEPAVGFCLTSQDGLEYWERFDKPVNPQFAGAELTVSVRIDWKGEPLS